MRMKRAFKVKQKAFFFLSFFFSLKLSQTQECAFKLLGVSAIMSKFDVGALVAGSE